MVDEPEFPKDAYINKETGMYQAKEPSPNHAEFIEDDASGLLVPRPKHKPHRRLLFGIAGYVDCIESMDHVRAMYDLSISDESPAWFEFIDPVYGTMCSVPRAKLRTLECISEAWTDIDAIKTQIAEVEAMRRDQQAQARGIQVQRRR